MIFAAVVGKIGDIERLPGKKLTCKCLHPFGWTNLEHEFTDQVVNSFWHASPS